MNDSKAVFCDDDPVSDGYNDSSNCKYVLSIIC